MNNKVVLRVIVSYFIFGFAVADNLQFADDFIFGVASASYQVEGAWNESGKGENIWDRLTHDHPDWIADKTNGDIACDSYHKIEEDVRNLRWLGVDFYRFSLSWSRLLPSGFSNKINPDGVRYYNDLINELLKYNITPMLTLFHWDLPQPLQEAGGWPNVLLADYFEDYAKIAFDNFGDRVKMWITFNEPQQICQEGYSDGKMAPAYHSDGIADYLCGRTVLLAHAKAYHLYNKQFREKQQGRVGITIDSSWFEPETNSTEDKNAAERAVQIKFGWWAHPIFSKSGDYPEIMKERIDNNSKQELFTRSRLPPFSREEIKFIQGTHDFFGFNHYTTWLVREPRDNDSITWNTPSYSKDIGVISYQDSTWPSSAASWLKVVPSGFKKVLNWIKNEYSNPEIYITENGYADTGELNDVNRVNYYEQYLQALLEAIHEDGCNIKGYAAWSLQDNFEWRDGFSVRFGLFRTELDANRTRIAKQSASVYKSIIKTKMIGAPPTVKNIN
ncbi:uncharacterized protein CBL_01981 [Carabus blaptoides fortunei]